MQLWEEKFSKGAEAIPAARGTIYWHDHLGLSGLFSFSPDATKWRTPFALVRRNFNQNMIVEINPPLEDISPRIQGLMAIAPDGDRWVLHQGALRTARKATRAADHSIDRLNDNLVIPSAQFDRIAGLPRCPVRFSNGQRVDYVRVVNLNAPPGMVQTQIADFVQTCRRVKLQCAKQSISSVISGTQGRCHPESQGRVHITAREQTYADRVHADVWHALAAELDALQVKRSSGRFGRFGPDMVAKTPLPVLFEIKTATLASYVHQALGQLMIYGKLLKQPHRKVLVVPDELPPSIKGILGDFGVAIITYRTRSEAVCFNRDHLRALLLAG